MDQNNLWGSNIGRNPSVAEGNPKETEPRVLPKAQEWPSSVPPAKWRQRKRPAFPGRNGLPPDPGPDVRVVRGRPSLSTMRRGKRLSYQPHRQPMQMPRTHLEKCLKLQLGTVPGTWGGKRKTKSAAWWCGSDFAATWKPSTAVNFRSELS